MPLARPRANQLSIPIPTTSLWRLRRQPTPQRAGHPLTFETNTPLVPSLSLWDTETPPPLLAILSPMSAASALVTPGSESSRQQDSAMSLVSKPSSWYSQSEEPAMSPAMVVSTMRPRLHLSPISPYSPISPESSLSLLSATSPVSPRSPYNPFLSPPAPRPITTFFRFASPLLPASPLSIFDRAISPTSSTLLLMRTPLSDTFDQHLTLLGPNVAELRTWDNLSPTFLGPRTPPALPRPPVCTEYHVSIEEVEIEASQRGCSLAAPRPSSAAPRFSSLRTPAKQLEQSLARDERKEMKMEFYHYLATKRAAALNRLSGTPSVESEKRHGKGWRRMFKGGRKGEVMEG